MTRTGVEEGRADVAGSVDRAGGDSVGAWVRVTTPTRSARPRRTLRYAGLLVRRVGGAQGVAVVAGLGLVAVATMLEHGPAGCVARAAPVVPLAMPLLVGVGSWAAARRARVRGELRTLAAMGHGAAGWVLAGALLGAALAVTIGAMAAPLELPAEGWVRGAGGWWRGGVPVPDLPGGAVGPAVAPGFAWGRALLLGGLGGAVGGVWGRS